MSLPRYTLQQLEQKAEDVINYFAPEYCSNAKAVPVQSFVDALHSAKKVAFSIADLGFVGSTAKILGLFISHPQYELLIDKSIVNTIRYNFTLAHELGHFVLHRKVDVGGSISDTSSDLFETPTQLQTERQWAEWQANNFAASILMPKKSLLNFVNEHADKFGIQIQNNCIIHKNTMGHLAAIERFAEYTATNYDVSKTSALIRLKKTKVIE